MLCVPLLKEHPTLAVAVEAVVREPLAEVHPVLQRSETVEISIDIQPDHLTLLELLLGIRLDPRMVLEPDEDRVLQLPEVWCHVAPCREAVAPSALSGFVRLLQTGTGTRTGDTRQR